MAMINLFKKFQTACITAIAVLCSFACSDKIAGTAEEPNQFAYGTESSSSTENLITSSESTPAPIDLSSSSSNRNENSTPDIPSQKNSSSSTLIGGNGGAGHSGTCYSSDGQQHLCGNSDPDLPTLDDLLKKYNITEASFDNNVRAYNKTFQSCYESTGNCNDKQNIADLRTLGLHKFTNENISGLAYLFLETSKVMGGKVYGTDDKVSFQIDGCPLYVLNIHDTSPAIHVLTKITKDTIYITDFYDKCDYEPRPFDMHVGYLIEYCGELSENLKIEIAFKQLDTADCSDISYEEYIRKE